MRGCGPTVALDDLSAESTARVTAFGLGAQLAPASRPLGLIEIETAITYHARHYASRDCDRCTASPIAIYRSMLGLNSGPGVSASSTTATSQRALSGVLKSPPQDVSVGINQRRGGVSCEINSGLRRRPLDVQLVRYEMCGKSRGAIHKRRRCCDADAVFNSYY
ncbi:unnamed protein product, partial [Iphiclides podalirius]